MGRSAIAVEITFDEALPRTGRGVLDVEGVPLSKGPEKWGHLLSYISCTGPDLRSRGGNGFAAEDKWRMCRNYRSSINAIAG